jgi:hypothetical protein
MGERMMHTGFGWKNLKERERDHVEYEGVDMRIT